MTERMGASERTEPVGPAEPGAAAADGWQRLHPRNRLVALLFLLGPPVVFGLVWLIGRDAVPPGVLWTLGPLGATGMAVGAGTAVEWFTVRYRITGERLDLRSGFAVRNNRSIPRDRIRSVDVQVSPLDRIFGLATVKVGTGQHVGAGDKELRIAGVAPREADRLREMLLRHPTPAGSPAHPAAGAVPGGSAGQAGDTAPGVRSIARLNWAWIRYAPLTMSSLLAIFAVLGALYKPIDAMNIDPMSLPFVSGVVGEAAVSAWWLVGLMIVAAVLVLAVLSSLVIFVGTWWGFRLEREPGGTLRTRRGLLTTRSVSLEERRLRGVEIAEPLLLRWGGGARVNAVAVGLSSRSGSGQQQQNVNARALLPPAPRAQAHRVAARVLDADRDPTSTVRLTSHPRAALRRRITRALLATVLVVVVLAVLAQLWLPGWSWLPGLLVLPVALSFAFDAYRNLGHGITGRYLVTRSGTGIRRSVALRRDGVIGWKITRSPFQRRAGLATLVATTAANDGSYKVRDVQPDAALALAEDAVPGMLAPFLERT